MRVDPLLALRFEAWRTGRALPAYTHQRIALRPHALFLTAIQFPGEDNSMFAAAVGDRAHQTPFLRVSTPDPRLREEAADTVGQLHTLLERYFRRCDGDAVAPQIVVTSQAALRHLRNIADDLRFFDHAPTVAAFATALSYFTLRAEVPDQQAVLVMTDVLRTHWVTSLDPTQTEHLGALVAAIQPPDNLTVLEAVRRAEQAPMGARTTPQFDHDVLRPALERFHAARRRGVPCEEIALLREEIAHATGTVVETMYATLQRAAEVLERAKLAVLPQVADWQAAEQQAFLRFRSTTARGSRAPRTDKSKGGTFRYAEREQALITVEAAVACADEFARARAVASGEIVEGVVTSVRRALVPGQARRAILVDVITRQSTLRVREGHELADRGAPRARYLVRAVRIEGGTMSTPTTRLVLQMIAGMRAVGAPMIGASVTLVREVPDLQRLGRIRGALAQKLSLPHWTLGGPPPLPVPPGRRASLPRDLPDSPLQALEVLW